MIISMEIEGIISNQKEMSISDAFLAAARQSIDPQPWPSQYVDLPAVPLLSDRWQWVDARSVNQTRITKDDW